MADQFKLDAMTIDPTITGLWAYSDMTIDGCDSAFQSLYLERVGSPRKMWESTEAEINRLIALLDAAMAIAI